MPNITRNRLAVTALIGVLAAGGIGVISSARASPAENGTASPNCKTWDDGTTFGVSCDGGSYLVEAQCSKGPSDGWMTGPGVNSPKTSYVHCSSVGGTYVAGSGHAVFITQH